MVNEIVVQPQQVIDKLSKRLAAEMTQRAALEVVVEQLETKLLKLQGGPVDHVGDPLGVDPEGHPGSPMEAIVD